MHNLALVFPGQGSQYVGMGSALYNEFQPVRDVFSEASDVLGIDMVRLCFEGPQGTTRPDHLYPNSVLTMDIAVFRLFESEIGIKPSVMAGHSLGEYSALHAAGALDFPGTLKLVESRARHQQDAVPLGKGGMAAVLDLKADQVEQICSELRAQGYPVYISIINSPGQVSVSGYLDALEQVILRAKEIGGRAIIIP